MSYPPPRRDEGGLKVGWAYGSVIGKVGEDVQTEQHASPSQPSHQRRGICVTMAMSVQACAFCSQISDTHCFDSQLQYSKVSSPIPQPVLNSENLTRCLLNWLTARSPSPSYRQNLAMRMLSVSASTFASAHRFVRGGNKTVEPRHTSDKSVYASE